MTIPCDLIISPGPSELPSKRLNLGMRLVRPACTFERIVAVRGAQVSPYDVDIDLILIEAKLVLPAVDEHDSVLKSRVVLVIAVPYFFSHVAKRSNPELAEPAITRLHTIRDRRFVEFAPGPDGDRSDDEKSDGIYGHC